MEENLSTEQEGEPGRATVAADKTKKDKCMKIYGCHSNADHMHAAVAFGSNPKVPLRVLYSIKGGLADAIKMREDKGESI